MNRKEAERKVRDVVETISVFHYPGSGETVVYLYAAINGKKYEVSGQTKLGHGDTWCYQTGREIAFERAVNAIVEQVLADNPELVKAQPKMQQAVMVEPYEQENSPGYYRVWCDPSLLDAIKAIPGVSKMTYLSYMYKNAIGVHINDPRYDPAEVIAAIEAVGEVK